MIRKAAEEGAGAEAAAAAEIEEAAAAAATTVEEHGPAAEAASATQHRRCPKSARTDSQTASEHSQTKGKYTPLKAGKRRAAIFSLAARTLRHRARA